MKQSRNLMWLFLAAIVLAVVFFAPWRLHQESERTEPPMPEMANAPVAGKLEPRQESTAPHGPESAPAAEPGGGGASPNLPSLPESDPSVRDRLTGLSTKPQWRKWLTHEQLVRKATSFIAQLAKGDVDRRAADFLAPRGKFAAIETSGGRYALDPASYQRYNPIADVIESIDAGALSKAYREFRPLFQAAFAELGYPGQPFDTTIAQAIDMLLATPVLKGEVELIRPSVMYKFADPQIEGLHPAQKQLIRMGPRNMQKIQGKLRAFKAEFVRAGDR